MIFDAKQTTLKNGTVAVLKTPEAGDGEKMLNCIKACCGETEFLVRYPEEWEGMTVEKEEKCICWEIKCSKYTRIMMVVLRMNLKFLFQTKNWKNLKLFHKSLQSLMNIQIHLMQEHG